MEEELDDSTAGFNFPEPNLDLTDKSSSDDEFVGNGSEKSDESVSDWEDRQPRPKDKSSKPSAAKKPKKTQSSAPKPPAPAAASRAENAGKLDLLRQPLNKFSLSLSHLLQDI